MIKPFPKPYPKPERLPERNAVTIVFGLKTPQGVVLSADTQETYEGSHKVNRPKLIYKADTNLCGIPLVLAVAGAGVGPWIDKLTTAMWEAIQDSTNLDEACLEVERAIKKQYTDFQNLVTFDPTADLIYAVGTPGAVRLFYAYGAIVNEERWHACGSGQAIADFLMHNFNGSIHITNGIAIAVYILMNAKRHADGCGGDTHLVVVHKSGFSSVLDSDQIAGMERVLDSARGFSDTMIMAAGNPVMTPDTIKLAAKVFIEGVAYELSKLNQTKGMKELLEYIQREDDSTKHVLRQSIPQTSTDQQ